MHADDYNSEDTASECGYDSVDQQVYEILDFLEISTEEMKSLKNLVIVDSSGLDSASFLNESNIERFKLALQQCSQLSSISLDFFCFDKMTNIAFKGFCDALLESKYLEELKFYDCTFRSMSATNMLYLGYKLGQYPQLHSLDLSGAMFGMLSKSSATAFGFGLSRCNKLKSLFIPYNISMKASEERGAMLSSEGESLLALCDGLHKCSNLEIIDFSGNFLTQEGMSKLGLSLAKCPKLSTVELYDYGQAGLDYQESFAEGITGSNITDVKLGVRSENYTASPHDFSDALRCVLEINKAQRLLRVEQQYPRPKPRDVQNISSHGLLSLASSTGAEEQQSQFVAGSGSPRKKM